MSDPVYIHMCDKCKNEFSMYFNVDVLNPNYEQYKCASCGKKTLCRAYKLTTNRKAGANG